MPHQITLVFVMLLLCFGAALQPQLFSDDDKIHSNESETNKDESKGRETELAMDPLGNPEMTSASNQCEFCESLIQSCGNQ